MNRNQSTNKPKNHNSKVVSTASLFFCIMSTGCYQGSSTAVSSSTSVNAAYGQAVTAISDRRSIDAGVVLADRGGYYCFSLEQIGLPLDADILSVESSCECVQPSIISYVADKQQVRKAILLEFASDDLVKDNSVYDTENDDFPAFLGVVITIALEGGETHEFTVNMVHTILAS